MSRIESIPLTAADTENVTAAITMLAIARGRRPHKREPFYRAAGQHLDMLRRGKHTEVWAEIVRTHVGIGLARAYELVAIAGGKALADLRAEKNVSSRRWKASKRRQRENSEMGSGA